MQQIGAEPPIFGIEDALAASYGNNFTADFIPVSGKIAARAFRIATELCENVSPPKNEIRKGQNTNAIMHILKPQFIFEDRILRSLLAEASITFTALQKKRERDSKADYIKISQTYRNIIRACLEKLQKANEEDKDKGKYKQYISIFYSIECVWHLCEIFFVDSSSRNQVVPQLLEWTSFHFPTIECAATSLLLSGREACENDDYWPTVRGAIMQGNLDIARALLRINPSAESAAFKVVEQIFAKMPTQYGGIGHFKQNSRSKWEYWKTDTERKLAANILVGHANLEELVMLVLGNKDAWNAEIAKSTCWYELFAGYLFYINPDCKQFELGNVANDWLIRWGQLKGFDSNNLPLKPLDQVILHLMENDMNRVISEIQEMGDNQWFITHIIDLLYHCDQLHIIGERHNSNECTELRDSLVRQFGSNLMFNQTFWQLGISYLENSSNRGRVTLELLLPRLTIHTMKMAQTVIAVARKNGLFNIEQEICKVQSRRLFTVGRYGSALEWAIRSKDTILVAYISDFLLKHYVKTGNMLCPDVIGNIGAKMFASSRLVFLVKYFDFHQYYRKREFLLAAELLVNLLESKITPEYFWPSLLVDSIPLLESKDPKIMKKETCAILRNLESELVPLIEKAKESLKKNAKDPIELLKDYSIEQVEEIVNMLRLACARNLARAIIIENTMENLSVS